MFIFRSFIYTQKRKTTDIQCFAFILSDPDRIQTCNLLIRSQMLYSVKLRGLFLRVQRYNIFVTSQYLPTIFYESMS